MLYLLQDWEQAYCVHKTKIFVFILKFTNIDQESSKVEGAKSALPQYYRVPKYRGYIDLKMQKTLHAGLKIVLIRLWYI